MDIIELDRNAPDYKRRLLLGGLVGAVTESIIPILGGSTIASHAQAETIASDIFLPDFSTVLDKKPDTRFSHIFGKENMQIDSQMLKVTHPKGSYGPSSGSGFLYELPRHATYATLGYELVFKSDEPNGAIDFGRGGKLPGFSGGDDPRGGDESANGFSTRLMWTKNGGIDIYLYTPGKKETYGTHTAGDRSFQFESGKTYQIQQDLKLNTPGKNNGSIVLYVDKKEIAKLSGIVFREDDTIDIHAVMFSNFLGGHDKTWASRTTFQNHFRNFRVTYRE